MAHNNSIPDVAIIMGSDSDLPVMIEACKVLDSFGVSHETTVVSAHRTPDRMFSYTKAARARGIKVIIAGAGGAAHLPGMVASLTSIPVIGVPVQTKALAGLDSLYSIVQMPGGIPVATVAINGAKNAGLLALRILASSNTKLYEKLDAYQVSLRDEVEEKAQRLEESGPAAYLADM